MSRRQVAALVLVALAVVAGVVRAVVGVEAGAGLLLAVWALAAAAVWQLWADAFGAER